ncbi:sensor histidine kinase [Dokdonella immobilis]|uniref:histidine kinase n=1 Tax=Dokdonella immobilis TaxID=578942 RepID=A0A1I4VA19_9GAMM|nr:HAMP domain-containing sensor histidine kinase [Dokdonella immobilis]SFM97870.1 Signal transduction histidine kinase [Dokdonella immobilis]
MRRFPLFRRFYLVLVAALILFAIVGVTMRHTMAEPLPLPLWALLFVLMAMFIGLGSYPFVRRLTRRLSRLQQSVAAFGRGELGVRAVVEGGDEIAELAEGFNLAADRIETLVAAHKRLLANASHELRTPLTRIRMGIELLGSADDQRRSGLALDLRELDDLIEEILLASRLEALPATDGAVEELDLLALVAEECARFGQVDLDYPISDGGRHAQWLQGNQRLLRRLVRNLLENAHRHGAPPISVHLCVDGESLQLRITDAGPGVDEADRERVFEPFFRAGTAEENIGSGLGLSLVRQIARHHGGDVHCRGRPGGGSEFVVQLPRSLPGASHGEDDSALRSE